MAFWESQNYRDRKQISGCQKVGIKVRVEEYKEIFFAGGEGIEYYVF